MELQRPRRLADPRDGLPHSPDFPGCTENGRGSCHPSRKAPRGPCRQQEKGQSRCRSSHDYPPARQHAADPRDIAGRMILGDGEHPYAPASQQEIPWLPSGADSSSLPRERMKKVMTVDSGSTAEPKPSHGDIPHASPQPADGGTMYPWE